MAKYAFMKQQLVFDSLQQVDSFIGDYHWKESISEKEHQLRRLVLTLLATNTISVSWFSTRELNWDYMWQKVDLRLWSCTDNIDPQKVTWQFVRISMRRAEGIKGPCNWGSFNKKMVKIIPTSHFTEKWEPPEVSLPLYNSHDGAI